MHALREFRGDGHVAVLTANGLTGSKPSCCTRGWACSRPTCCGPRAVAAGGCGTRTVEELRGRGSIAPDEVRLSEVGQMYRGQIETQTDELTMPAYEQIGQAGAERILELAPAVVDAVTSVFGRISRESMTRATTEEP